MHHLTTLNLPTPQGKAAIRQQLEASTEAFFMSGGSIQVADSYTYKPKPYQPVSSKMRNAQDSNERRRRLAAERRRAQLTEKIRGLACIEMAYGVIYRTSVELMKELNKQGHKVTRDEVEQILALHGIKHRIIKK